jgi:hypothetical protein
MIQYPLVRGLLRLLVLASAATSASATAHARPPAGTVAVYWQPPGVAAIAERVRSAFADVARRLGAPLLDASEAPTPRASLLPQLAAARADYIAFRFVNAVAKLDDLERLAEAHGGGDLDTVQLADVYLYRALARLEIGPPESAWDDLVRAARLDPARILDPARFPPRALAAFHRATAEAAQLPRATLRLVVPSGATVRLDGRLALGEPSVLLGLHFVAVDADGYEPWAGVVTVAGTREQLKPPLRACQPPDADRLVALTRKLAPRRVVGGALVREGEGWRFVGRELRLADGATVTESAALGASPVVAVVEGVTSRLSLPELAASKPRKSRWWIWAAAGVAAALAVAIPIGVVYGTSSANGTVGGAVGPLR